MSALTFYFAYDMGSPIGSLAVENGELTSDGCGEDVAYSVRALDGGRVLGPADGDTWLQGIATRMQGGYIVADFHDGEAANRHYPLKHNQDDHGNWAREKGGLLDNEANVKDWLLNGKLTITGRITKLLSGINAGATVKGMVETPNGHMKVFIKTASMLSLSDENGNAVSHIHKGIPMGTDLEREMAVQIANEMLGGIVRTEPAVLRDIPGRGMSLRTWKSSRPDSTGTRARGARRSRSPATPWWTVRHSRS